MTHVKAREWIKPLPAGRKDPLDAGCKDTLQGLWDHVNWSIEREPVGTERPWVSAEQLAKETGEKLSTVRDRLRKISAAGFARYERRGWSLAWREPWTATQVAPEIKDECDSSGTPARLESPPHATTVASVIRDQPETFSLTPPSSDPPSKPKSKATIELETIRALHQELAIAAFKHHGLNNPKAKRPKGTLPAPTTKAGKTLDNRIKSAIKDHGIERCEQAIRWRYKDWLVNKKQLAWGPETVWSEGSLGFIFGRIDIGEEPKGTVAPASQRGRGCGFGANARIEAEYQRELEQERQANAQGQQ